MNTYDNNGLGMSSNTFDRWVQKSNPDDSAITKMQHQFWVTKQTLSRKLGKKEDECIVASDAELDAKLELFRSIQESCSYLQRVIDRYQERLCNLAQEENTMGRFLKEASKQDKTRAGKMMSAVGKSLSYSGQQRLALRAPLIRLYQEVETFRQRAIEDTLQNVQAMEKARTEYRAALSWMKNISQELDPDTTKQLDKFRKVQTRVRRNKAAFDHLALDCLQKVDLLAAARCNMFSHALVLYQSTLLNFTKKSAQAYSTIANSFKGYQRYEFTVIKELAETSTRLAHETGGDEDLEDNDKLLSFEPDYEDNIEQAEEVKAPTGDEQLLDIYDSKDDQIFGKLPIETSEANISSSNEFDLEKNLTELDLAMDSFTGMNLTLNDIDSPLKFNDRQGQSFNLLSNENQTLLDDIFSIEQQSFVNDWDAISNDTFLPPSILKQSLGDAAMGMIQKDVSKTDSEDSKTNKNPKAKTNSWLDLFAELDPLANNPMENLPNDSNAPA